MPNSTVSIFAPLFEQKLALLQNPICQVCNVDSDLKHPLLPWIVGSKFHQTEERVMFVGKPHRGIPGKIRSSGLIDPTDEILGADGLWNMPSNTSVSRTLSNVQTQMVQMLQHVKWHLGV
jgi:hypothetical protein